MMNALELRIPPLALFIVFAVAIWSASAYLPGGNIVLPGYRIIAMIVVLLGCGVVSAGVFEFRRSKTTMSPFSPERTASIVSSGIYDWSRNPMYLGMALVLFGVAIWCCSLPGIVVAMLFCAYMTRFQIRPEERTLLKLFGTEYSAYLTRVRRWI